MTARSIFVPAKLPLLGFALGTLATLIFVHLRLYEYCADDAYIHFRISSNFLDHGKPFFNPQEPVMASSSALWTLLISLVFLISGKNILAIAILNALIVFSAALIYARIAGLIYGAPSWRLQGSIFIVSLAALLGSSLQLMETGLAVLLLGVGVERYFRGKNSAFFWLILAVFVRLELSVFLILLMLENLLLRRVMLRSMTIGVFAGLLPFLAYSYFYFGGLIPQTVKAKAIIYHLSSSEFLTFAAAGLLGKYLFLNFPLVVLLFFSILTVLSIYLFLHNLSAAEYVSRDQRALLLLCGGLLIFLAYLIERVYLFPWYMPLFLLPIYFYAVLASFTKKSRLVSCFAVLLVAPALFSFARDLAAGLGDPSSFSEYEGGLRAQEYRKIGSHLFLECPSCSAMSAEIGGLGYGFQGTIFDAAGLASPEALSFHSSRSAEREAAGLGGNIPAGYVQAKLPNYIVGMESFLGEFLKSDISKKYAPMVVAKAYSDRDGRLRVYRLR